MPSRAAPRNGGLDSSSEFGHGMEFRRARQAQPSRFAREKSLSPRASQSLKFKDKAVRTENPICPPNADMPFEFVKTASRGYLVQSKHQSDEVRKNASKDDELIRYMSKVPGYLQKGDKPQGNILNFGVLDWGRLENWTNNQSKSSGNAATSSNGSSIPSAVVRKEAFAGRADCLNSSHSTSDHTVGVSPVVRPLKEKTVKQPLKEATLGSFMDKKQAHSRRDEINFTEGLDLKSVERKEKGKWQESRRKHESRVRKGKEKCSNNDKTFVGGTESLNLSSDDNEVLGSSNKNVINQSTEQQKATKKVEGDGIDNPDQNCSGKQESIILLLPKDFSRPSSSEVSQRPSVDGKSAQLNWGSFSDIFSVDEIHLDESFSDTEHSCSLNNNVETEVDLDMKLENIIKSQGVELPVNPPDAPSSLSVENNVNAEACSSTVLKATDRAELRAPSISTEMSRDSARQQRFSFDIGRLTRSLSFKETSACPPMSSTYMTAKSGPVKPEGSASSEISNGSKAAISGRARASPLRRLLHPLLKSKSVRQREHPNDLRMKPPIQVEVLENEKCEPSTIKALVHLTVKSGLPLFKFVVEINNEILASTVKSLHSVGKDDMSWLYTFYSVNKVRKKSSGWTKQKAKPCGFSYSVVGQMKVSKPRVLSWSEEKTTEIHQVKESVLYSVDVNNASNAATSELMAKRELAAVVVNVPDQTGKYDFADEKFEPVVVILPGADHSLPIEGVPSSLINRWRTGGLCDCGGWDEGCKLKILTELEQDRKVAINSRSRSTEIRCDLYDQGEARESKPFFRLVPFRDGLFSVEFDAKISSLQAFSICVAVISGKQKTLSSEPTVQAESKQEFSRSRAFMAVPGEGPDILTPHPPLSPAGRV